MDNSKFSQRLKDILLYSKEEAIRLGDNEILPEHFFLGMLRDGDFDLMRIIESSGINVSEAKKSIERQLRRDKMLPPTEAEYIPFAQSSQKMLNQVGDEASGLHAEFVGPEHLLLTILKDKENTITTMFNVNNIDYEKLRERFKVNPTFETD